MSSGQIAFFALAVGLPVANLSRVVAAGVWIVVCVVLTFTVKPDAWNLKAAAATGLTTAFVDYAAEIAAGRFGLWSYRLEGAWLGLPPDLLIDIFSLGFSFCLVWVAFERRYPERRHAVVFVSVTGIILGTAALIHNTVAARQGFVSFGGSVQPGTPLFAAGNYVLMTALSAGVMLLFKRYRNRLDRNRPEDRPKAE